MYFPPKISSRFFSRFCTARECIIVKPNFQQTRLCHTLRRSARATIAASSSMEGGYLHVCGAASRRQQEMSHAEYEYIAQLLVLFSAVCTQLGNQGVPEARRPSSLEGNVHKRILFLLEWKINKTTTRKIYYLYLYQLVRMKWRREKTSVHIFWSRHISPSIIPKKHEFHVYFRSHNYSKGKGQ